MKKLIGAMTAIAILASAGAALADTANGKIKSVDQTTRMIILDNGHSYEAAKTVDISKLKAGELVTLTFSVVNGKNGVSSLKM